uniref:CSON004713 protein n=1 Tax=Culicoides sonorensis TaxID=179676 RepID=A0A336MTW7_CULSO
MSFIPKSDQLQNLNPVKIFHSLKRLNGKFSLKKIPGKQTKISKISNLQKVNRITLNKSVLRHALFNTFHTFTRETTIHGIKNIFIEFKDGELKDNAKVKLVANKIIWSVSCMTSLIFCLSLMVLTYQHFFAVLTTTTIESINYPISRIPFPAVTVCNINKVFGPNARTMWDKINGVEKDEYMKFLKSLSKLSTFELESDNMTLDIERRIFQNGLNPGELIRGVSKTCDDLLFDCELRGDPIECSKIFRRTRSNEGFCCSFNYFGLRDHLELYASRVKNVEYKVEGAGEYVGLKVTVNTTKEDYISPSHPFYGVLVILHEATNYPEFSTSVDVAQPGQEVYLAVTPRAIVSTDDVRRMPINQRFCTFPDEQEISMSDDYSFENCLSECRAKVIVRMCGCIPYYYPVFDEKYASVPTCRLKDTPCLYENRSKVSFFQFNSLKSVKFHFQLGLFQSIQVNSEEMLQTQTDKTSKNGLECDCLPTCSSLKFYVERFTGNVTQHPALGNHSLLHVFFSALTCIKYRRDIYMTWDGLLSTFGGLFSLCLGGSIISLIELVYFATYFLYTQIHNQIVKRRFKAITRLVMVKNFNGK